MAGLKVSIIKWFHCNCGLATICATQTFFRGNFCCCHDHENFAKW